MNFQDYCKQFQAFKESKGLNREITRTELASLREKFRGLRKPQAGKSALHEAVSNFRRYKASKGLGSEVTFLEFKKLKEGIRKMSGESLRENRLARRPDENFRKLVEQYRQYKISKGAGNKVSEKEIRSLREKTSRAQRPAADGFHRLIENFRAYKKANGKGDKVSYGEIKSLKEKYMKAGGRLREADAGFDPNAGLATPANPSAGMGMDPNAMGGAPAAVDPNISAQIQDVKNSVDALAQAAGIQTAPLGADPNAGIPPADGMGADGTAGQVPQQVMEGLIQKFTAYTNLKENRNPTTAEIQSLREKASEIQAINQFKNYVRIRERRDATPQEISVLKGKLKESKGSAPKSKLDQIKERIAAREAARKDLREKATGPKEGEEQVVIPAASALANGVDGGKGATAGKTWPTTKTKGDAALQGAGAQQTKGPSKGKLEESVQSITEAYVDRKLNAPKLDFKSLKESLSQGMLG